MVVDRIDFLVNDESYSCFGDDKIYKQSVEVAQNIFPNKKYLGMGPKFFEIYNNKKSKGIVVDTQDLEIRIINNRSLKNAKKLLGAFQNNGLDYKVVREAD